MTILGIDTAGRTMSVALLENDTLLCEQTLATGLTHSETLLPTVDAVLKAAGKTCADIDLFGVCAGPGSFTGLRIGLCAVKGLAFPANTPCAAVSTLEALAWSHAGTGTVVAAQDARRGEVYWAAFDLATHQRITPDAASPVEEIRTVAETCPKPLLFVGDGAYLCESAFSAVPGVLPCPAALRVARAAGVCLAAKAMAERGETCPPAALLPSYHRLSQAERQRAERLAQTTEG
ncbi:MAG: tRNA (adenosine(37)-N6)-threonylcarbamoyltransferase complex dimerization subunit type 1 TsaB [Subdoligranulum sp.]|nr:tRNA (adenosine(37)-N6)-threonylcarbamoyltransferase complex dimerization subunit type 1 TsaB [Subdoligranulum sp.]